MEDGWDGWMEGPLGNYKRMNRSLYPTCVVLISSSSEATAEAVFRAGLPCQLVLNAIIMPLVYPIALQTLFLLTLSI